MKPPAVLSPGSLHPDAQLRTLCRVRSEDRVRSEETLQTNRREHVATITRRTCTPNNRAPCEKASEVVGVDGCDGCVARGGHRPYILGVMRMFSLLFVAIAVVMLAMFLIYVIRGPVDPLIAGGLFVSFLACLAPALFLLKPFEPPEELHRRREARRERAERRRFTEDPPRDPGS